MPACTAGDASMLAAVTDIFRDLLRDPELELSEQTTRDDLPGWDSMMHIAIVVEAECRFDVQFRTAEIEELDTIGTLIRHIRMKQTHTAA